MESRYSTVGVIRSHAYRNTVIAVRLKVCSYGSRLLVLCGQVSTKFLSICNNFLNGLRVVLDGSVIALGGGR